jgi:hypothetical protein
MLHNALMTQLVFHTTKYIHYTNTIQSKKIMF